MPLTLLRQPDLTPGDRADYHVMRDGRCIARIYQITMAGHVEGWWWGASFPGDPPGPNGGFELTFDGAKARVRERVTTSEMRGLARDVSSDDGEALWDHAVSETKKAPPARG